mmetsp:Transcript_35102/g.60428  ORF Transcript_35102/g.60428 Transcript_35102/m.60428 type:complete len:375 (-) Transcript_35102:60-1184(-)
MRRNIAPRRRMVEGWGFSPRLAAAFFFVFCAFTYGAIIGWEIIIKSNDEFLETGAALMTVLVFLGVSFCIFRRYRAHRQGLIELRQAHPDNSVESEDVNLSQLRRHLRLIAGTSFDAESLLTNAGGLPAQLINALVRNYVYSNNEESTLARVNDVELGLCRTNTGNSVSDLNSTRRNLNMANHENCADAQCGASTCVEDGALLEGATSEFPSFPMECSVCLMGYEEGDVLSELPCRHIYHRACITAWLRLRNACPMCKQAVFVLPPLPTMPGPPVIDTTNPELFAEGSTNQLDTAPLVPPPPLEDRSAMELARSASPIVTRSIARGPLRAQDMQPALPVPGLPLPATHAASNHSLVVTSDPGQTSLQVTDVEEK